MKAEEIYHRLINQYHIFYVNKEYDKATGIKEFIIKELILLEKKGIKYNCVKERLEKELKIDTYEIPYFLRQK